MKNIENFQQYTQKLNESLFDNILGRAQDYFSNDDAISYVDAFMKEHEGAEGDQFWTLIIKPKEPASRRFATALAEHLKERTALPEGRSYITGSGDSHFHIVEPDDKDNIQQILDSLYGQAEQRGDYLVWNIEGRTKDLIQNF